ncbi:hypothetical protein BIW11_02896 [Tropilaelaps mercedesae]|uniref:Uncharacterized protein n=1 Tax=Tropilaelaps mercedesae TaxID=418985 RepID=A0A1V9XVG2_9ACAR|nr:hypothetical protein BIW11_02896 [Tropilaelaps mercedesae]
MATGASNWAHSMCGRNRLEHHKTKCRITASYNSAYESTVGLADLKQQPVLDPPPGLWWQVGLRTQPQLLSCIG